MEDREEHDLVRLPYIDTYRNSSIKVLQAYRWAPHCRYVLKIDEVRDFVGSALDI